MNIQRRIFYSYICRVMFDTLLWRVRKSLLIRCKWQNPWKKVSMSPYNLSCQRRNLENRHVWVLILRGGDFKGSWRRWVYSISKSNGFSIIEIGSKSLALFFLTRWLWKYLLNFNFLVCKIIIAMSASTTLESTEPSAKGIFVNMNDNVCQHMQKTMNSTILAMKITKVHNEE